MARRGRPTVKIVLRGDERSTLERWARRHSSSQALALRCRIVLACAAGGTNTDVGAELGVHPTTVSKWRHRFARGRLDGPVDAPRPGAARPNGREARHLSHHGGGDLAGVRAQAVAAGLVQGVPGPGPDRKDPRSGGVVPEP